MTDGFQVTPARLADARRQVSALAQELRTGADTIGADVAVLLGRGWSGPAAQEFDGAWQLWRQASVQVLGALDATADLLLAGAEEYQRQEDRTRAAFAQAAAA